MKSGIIVAGMAVALLAWLRIAAAPSPASKVQFTDVTTQAGIKFVHNAGKSGKKYLPGDPRSGAAFFDADGDGWIDILLVNGKDWTPRGQHTTAALYRNNHNGTFTDITRGSGLDVEMYGIGVAVADFDNDGTRRRLHHCARRGPPLSQRRQRQVQRRDCGIRNQECQFRYQRGVAGLRSRRQGGSVRRELCSMERKRRSVVLARRQRQVLLHARILQRHFEQALS